MPIFAPTNITLVMREAVYEGGKVVLRWETADEVDPVQVTEELLVAKKSGSPSGAAYTYEDETAQANVDYRYFVGILGPSGLETQSVLGNVIMQRTVNEWFIFLPITLK